MNNYKSFSELKEELGDNYDFKLYEMRISALKEIENLQQENQQLKANYERLYNENCKLREEHNINDISLLDENQKLKDNWNKLKEWVNKDYDYYINNENEDYIGGRLCFTDMKNKMQELEGSDSNDNY